MFTQCFPKKAKWVNKWGNKYKTESKTKELWQLEYHYILTIISEHQRVKKAQWRYV